MPVQDPVTPTKQAPPPVRTVSTGTQTEPEFETHADITYNPATQTLTLTVPFDLYTSAFYASDSFATWRSTLLSTLNQHSSLATNPTQLNILISIRFPHYRTHSVSVLRAQREVLKSIRRIVDAFDVARIGKCNVVMTAPELHWMQVQALATFWGLKLKAWTVLLREGEGRASAVRYGDLWEKRLRDEYRLLGGRMEL